MHTAEQLLEFRLPRWNELPYMGLYMDQVVSVIDRLPEPFGGNCEPPAITSTMVANYVKQKIIDPPHNKRYGREHIASLIIICVMKRLLTLDELKAGIEVCLSLCGSYEDMYNLFCDELEAALRRTFLREEYIPQLGDVNDAGTRAILAVRACATAFANIVYARTALARIGYGAAKPAKPDKAAKAGAKAAKAAVRAAEKAEKPD